MLIWTPEELALIEETSDVYVSPFREDGSTLGTPTRIWAVVVKGEVYIRPASGPGSSWYVAAIRQGAGQLRVGGEHRDVTFAAADSRVYDAVDRAYEDEYDHRPSIEAMQGAGPRSATVRVSPRRAPNASA
jgi:hypothetical protein